MATSPSLVVGRHRGRAVVREPGEDHRTLVVFAALTAMGAGLHLASESVTGHAVVLAGSIVLSTPPPSDRMVYR